MSVVIDEKRRKGTSLMPFVIEARTSRNQDLLIQNLDGMRLRGAVRATIEVFDRSWAQEDEEDDPNEVRSMSRPAPANLVDGIGELPGERLYVNPETGEWKTQDPLYEKKTTLERIRMAMRRHWGFGVVGQKLRGMKPRKGMASPDQMKSLCEELLSFIEADEAKVTKGRAPTREEIEQMKGRTLLNWMNRQNWKQPKYRDQLDDWERRTNQLDGSI